MSKSRRTSEISKQYISFDDFHIRTFRVPKNKNNVQIYDEEKKFKPPPLFVILTYFIFTVFYFALFNNTFCIENTVFL